MRAHSSKYATYKKGWHQQISLRLPQRPKIKKPARAIFLSIRSRYLDTDNLYGGSKPVRDVLRKLGYFWDDNPAWLEYYCFQVKHKERNQTDRTIIGIEWVDSLSTQDLLSEKAEEFGFLDQMKQFLP